VGLVPLGVGITVAYATTFTLSFLLNRRLTFDPERPVGVQVVLYVAVDAVNYAAIVLGVTQGLAAIGLPYQLARLAAGACEAAFLYGSMRWVVFGAAAHPAAGEDVDRTSRGRRSTPPGHGP
jgi:putative flippase GtrA